MRRLRRVALIVLVCSLLGYFFIRLTFVGFGFGYFDQVIVVEGNESPNQILYCTCVLDPDFRKLAEARADPTMFECETAEHVTGNRYKALIKFTSEAGLLYGQTISREPHLEVLMDFGNGRWVCRVLDLPSNTGFEPVVVRP